MILVLITEAAACRRDICQASCRSLDFTCRNGHCTRSLRDTPEEEIEISDHKPQTGVKVIKTKKKCLTHNCQTVCKSLRYSILGCKNSYCFCLLKYTIISDVEK